MSTIKKPSIMIVGFWTKTTIFKGRLTVPSIHTVAVEYSEGQYYVYNYYNDSQDVTPFSSLESMLGGEEKFIYGFFINK